MKKILLTIGLMLSANAWADMDGICVNAIDNKEGVIAIKPNSICLLNFLNETKKAGNSSIGNVLAKIPNPNINADNFHLSGYLSST